MHLETVRGVGVMEDGLERCIFQRCAVDITGHPIVIEDRRTLGSHLSQTPYIATDKQFKNPRVLHDTYNLRRK